MKNLIELSHTELILSFAASCIEGVARKLGIPYQEVFARMKRVGMIENYILPYYDTLHTESREHWIQWREHATYNMVECLITWEAKR